MQDAADLLHRSLANLLQREKESQMRTQCTSTYLMKSRTKLATWLGCYLFTCTDKGSSRRVALRVLGPPGGIGFPCICRRHLKNIVCSLQGDDSTPSGPRAPFDWVKSYMGEKYELTGSARLGPSSKDGKEVRVFNRIARWNSEGVEYVAGPLHVEQIGRDLDLTGSKPVTTPGLEPTFEQACHSKLLPPEKILPFRAIAARANYLAMDRPDIQYSAEGICRWMSAPTEASDCFQKAWKICRRPSTPHL